MKLFVRIASIFFVHIKLIFLFKQKEEHTIMQTRKQTNMIILHCSATREGQDIKAATIKKWHVQDKHWEDIGYHYVIDLDGTIENGRREDLVGAHCSGHNSTSIGICYIGGCDKNMKPKDTRTQQQKQSMYNLCKELMIKYHIPITDVHVHNEFDTGKACPSFSISQFRAEFSKWLAGVSDTTAVKTKKVVKCPSCGMEIEINTLDEV